MTIVQAIKSRLLPDRVVPCRVLRGPFRGAQFMANPQHSLRYIFGVYEHELNKWIATAIPRSRVLLDVGANHGYFSFGVMAAWKRLKQSGTIIAFEPQEDAFQCLRDSLELNADPQVRILTDRKFVGAQSDESTTTLSSAMGIISEAQRRSPMLIKIDVEGAEMDVLRGAKSLVRDGNLFLIEAHSRDLLHQVESFLVEHQHAYLVIEQRSTWWLSRENRSVENYWVVSKLS